ncbi:hypothetical protein F4776DRAFT_602930 [Hypoxylon sp. NC0597]|nr:hypothetical protein F4776DRAFT_602930 [Hypoxylon sp. NC0597]
MPKLRAIKREASEAEMPWPDPVAKRAKGNVKKEEKDDNTVDIGSVPKYENAEQIHDDSDDLEDAGIGFGTDVGLLRAGGFRRKMPEKNRPQKKALTLKDLEAIYPPDLIKELNAPRLGGPGQPKGVLTTHNSDVSVVYVVTHSKLGQWIDPEFDLVGTYSSAEVANLRVLSLFQEKYPDVTENWNDESPRRDGVIAGFSTCGDMATVGEDVTMAKGCPDEMMTNWWVDDDRALSLWTSAGDDGDSKICATRQEVGTNGLAGGRLCSVCSQ